MRAVSRPDVMTATSGQLGRRRINTVFVTILLGMLMAALDQTVVATALPTIVADLGEAGHMAWVVTSYLLASTVATAVVGKFGDQFGRKVVFQLAAVVFIGGSALSGLAGSMIFLIAARAIQGLGAGGLMVTAMALIADVVPLRERGKYQGALGAVFGVTTVLGPTLGGFLTDQWSWRWCFYINVPVAVAMVVLAAWTIPSVRATARPRIDYSGLALVAAASTGLILALEWGGDEYPWASPQVIGLFAGSGIAAIAFVLVERRAGEPILPMELFANPVFVVSVTLGFVVGFAMLGAMTFLPTYLQYVDGISATASGLRTLPLVLGLLTMSVLSGSVVGHTGHYKVFPIVGTAAMVAGLYLMSTLGPDSGVVRESVSMAVFGLGVGSSMQVLVIAVQNTVSYSQLGAATSGVTFFRTLGGAFGTAVFGTLFSDRLSTLLPAALARARLDPAEVTGPQELHRLPAERIRPVVDAYAEAIQHVFSWVIPVAAAGFVVSWFLKEVPLRDSARVAAGDVGDGFGAPAGDTDARLDRSVSQVMRQSPPAADTPPTERTAPLPPRLSWILVQVWVRTRGSAAASLTGIAYGNRLDPRQLRAPVREAHRAALLHVDGDALWLTDAGRAAVDRLAERWRRWLDARLDDWDVTDPADRAALDRAVNRIAERLLAEERLDGDDRGVRP